MSDRLAFIRDDPADHVACAHCGEMYPNAELDRLLWCEHCRLVERNRAGWWGWVAGVAFAACVAGYVWLVVRPTDLVISGWVATVVAAAWIGSKVAREVAYGILRARGGNAEPRTDTVTEDV